MNALTIPKRSGTYADALLAFGLLRLMDDWLKDLPRRWDIVLADAGPWYEIRVLDRRGRSLDLPDPRQATYFSSPAYYVTNRRFTELPEPGFPFKDVDDIWQRVRTYNEQRAALSQKGVKGTDLEQQLRNLEPPPEWQVVALIGTRQMQALQTYNGIVAEWAKTRGHFGEHLAAFLALARGEDGQTWKAWKKRAKQDGIRAEVTASQLLNPHQGKGQNQPKIASIQPGNIKSPWPVEYLKAAGLWEAAFPRTTTDNDWKVYILAPRQLRLRDLREVYRKFARVLWQERRSDTTALKTDITSVLLFYKTWLGYAAERKDEFDLKRARPHTVVHGFYVTQYKLMSAQAYTMLNQSFLRLPTWADAVTSWDDVKAWQALIDEHLDVIHAVDENHSDGYDMLKDYRDFVAGGRWEGFFAFTTAYAHYAMQRMAQNQYAPLFTTPHLRRLLMTEKHFTPILESEGFRNFAYAIRHSTVIPQSRKARGLDTLYDIRYGLGEELKRKATVREEFIAAVMNFAQSYNRENAQVLESKGQQMRRDLRTSDIEDMVRLVDQYGSEVVAHLLVAYGYAREPREEGNGE